MKSYFNLHHNFAWQQNHAYIIAFMVSGWVYNNYSDHKVGTADMMKGSWFAHINIVIYIYIEREREREARSINIYWTCITS